MADILAETISIVFDKAIWEPGRGLHSFTSQLNLSALYGIGGARKGCVAHVEGVLGCV
jgi:hypothetical protein